ncbi:hypothetical protein ACSBOB_20060 [Mesorhizobium sp. ASY16-5R]|uniref:hypothetical protein n=1 Tax=Mesorhizobium sp. ASY16-5R TaxID=3445772 RepID=UPI003FA0F9AB
MKFETIECLAPGELRRMLGKLIGTATCGRGNRGGIAEVARNMGMDHSTLSNVLAGRKNPGRKFLAYFGLEARQVIVRKTGSR